MSGRGRLQNRQRILDPVIKFLDQKAVLRFGARNRGGHPEREPDTRQQEDHSDRHGNREVAQQRTDERFLGDSDAHDPARCDRTRHGREQGHLLQRDRLKACFLRLEHLRVQRRRCAFADGLLGIRTRAKLTPLPSKMEMVQFGSGRCNSIMCWKIEMGGAERQVVDHLAIDDARHLDRDDRGLADGADKEIGIDGLAGGEDLFDHVEVVAKRQLRGIAADG